MIQHYQRKCRLTASVASPTVCRHLDPLSLTRDVLQLPETNRDFNNPSNITNKLGQIHLSDLSVARFQSA